MYIYQLCKTENTIDMWHIVIPTAAVLDSQVCVTLRQTGVVWVTGIELQRFESTLAVGDFYIVYLKKRQFKWKSAKTRLLELRISAEHHEAMKQT
jgi:hypothetical protein